MQIKTCVRWISQFVFAVVFLSVLLIQAGLASATQVPTISPSGGEYTSSQTVTIGNIDSGDTAYYTTDGSNPKTSSTATEYSGSFTVSQSEIVRAAVKDSSGDWSSVTGARFIIDNQSTNSDSSQISELTQELVSAIDNNQMGEAMQLLMQIEQLSNQNLNNSDNWDNSSNYNESSSSSSIDAPTISPNGGEYTSSQTVTIGNIGSGDTAYYTTDRSDPRTSSTA
ncbi:MAG: chitobiase/beta-hexosaminidase C-terminal domain-containing protein [Thermacetogeniaceae bacterium]